MGGCRDLIVGFGDKGFRVSVKGAEVGGFEAGVCVNFFRSRG